MTLGDPLYAEAAALAAGQDLPPEPLPEPIPDAPEPTKTELLARIEALAAQVAALP